MVLISIQAFSQSIKLEMDVARIPVTDSTVCLNTREKVMLVFEDSNIGVLTMFDTIELVLAKPFLDIPVYKDIRHNDQFYIVFFVKTSTSFAIFITPVKPYKRKLWSINLSSI